jgi:hypothetical protein
MVEKLINDMGNRIRTDNQRRTIVSSKIYIQWNDDPKMEVAMHEMPPGLAESFDRWLAMIEDEENAKLGL